MGPRWGPGSNPRVRSSFRSYHASAIMPISLPNASRMYSVACASVGMALGLFAILRRFRFLPPSRFFPLLTPFSPPYRSLLLLLLPFLVHLLSPHNPSSLLLRRRLPLGFTSTLSILSHPSTPLLTLSRRFLRIDVIGLFALFRLCLGSIVRDASFASRERGNDFSLQQRRCVTTRRYEQSALCICIIVLGEARAGNIREIVDEKYGNLCENVRILRIIKGIWSVDGTTRGSYSSSVSLLPALLPPLVIDEREWRPLCLIHACNL